MITLRSLSSCRYLKGTLVSPCWLGRRRWALWGRPTGGALRQGHGGGVAGSQEPRTLPRKGPWWARFHVSDGVGRGLGQKGAHVNCHLVFLTTLRLQRRELSQEFVLFCGRGPICPLARNKDVSMKGLPAVAGGGLWVPHFQVTPSCEANAGRCSTHSSELRTWRNKGPLFPSATKAGG